MSFSKLLFQSRHHFFKTQFAFLLVFSHLLQFITLRSDAGTHDINGGLPTFLVLLDAFLGHSKHPFVSVLVVIFHILCYLLNDRRKMITWVGIHKRLPDWKSRRRDYGNA